MHGRICILLVVLMTGCADTPAPSPRKELDDQEVALGASFDPAAAGVVRGRVTWDGDIPRGEEKTVRSISFDPNFYKHPARFVLPHHPHVDATSRGVADAVVFLRGIDVRRSKPWDHEAVRVVFQDRRLLVEQGKQQSGVGFVRRGAAFDVVNNDAHYHVLRGRGAGFFSFPFIEAKRAQAHTVTQSGIVDLTCAAGYYWLHAHLFVVEHPYYARTDADGRFSFDRVPPGKYDLICWLPSWHVVNHERDPETGTIVRLNWRPPVEQKRTIEVGMQGTNEIEYQWTAELFREERN